jgi:hypothetical protein
MRLKASLEAPIKKRLRGKSTNWKKDIWNGIFPKQIDNTFEGYKNTAWIFLLITIFTIVRSCIHIFAPDGGAGSIAGIDVSGAGGSNVVSMFAFWGLSQLLMGVVYLVVFFRYKSLNPIHVYTNSSGVYWANSYRIHKAIRSFAHSTRSNG